jgi:hypothetical protein
VVSETCVATTGGVGDGAIVSGRNPVRPGDTQPKGGRVGVFDLVLGMVFAIAVVFFVPERERLVDGERARSKLLSRPFGLSGDTVKES